MYFQLQYLQIQLYTLVWSYMLQDAHRREALLLPCVSPPQRSHEQPQCSHSEESWHVLAGDDKHSNNGDDDNDNDDSDNDDHDQ